MIHKQLEHEGVMAKKNELTYKKEIILFLDQIILPSNIAGIFRLADAFLVTQIFLRGGSDIFHSKKFRAIARTHENNLKYKLLSDSEIDPQLESLKNQGYKITALEFTNHSTLLPLHIFSDRTVLIIGSESHGVSEKILSHCDKSTHIPMQGNISSLNVTTACAMALYEIRRTDN